MTDLLALGSNAAAEDLLVLSTGTIRLDSSNMNLRLHDGSTAGGRVILNQDNADARYQAKSSELSGIGASFLPTQRGFMTRRGPGDYRIRKMVEDSNAISITNPDGYGGNITIQLKSTITGDRTFDGDMIITGVLQVDGGINADTSGTHLGNVTGDVTGNLTGNSTGTHIGPQIGDVDVRGHTLLLDDEQIPSTKISGLSGFIVASGVPIGGIIMWAGSSGSIPSNYRLCDGTNGTPDLRNRFIVGSGDTYATADTGGSATHNHGGSTSSDAIGSLSVDGHALTPAEMPTHTHHLASYNAFSPSAGPGYDPTETVADATHGAAAGVDTGSAGSGDPHTHTLSGTSDHDHTIASDSNLPPYYALAFIMRVA